MAKEIIKIDLSDDGENVTLKFSDAENVKLSSYDWYGLNFARKCGQISNTQYGMLLRLEECTRAKNKLLSLLSYSGNSRKGFETKLKRYGFSPESIECALDFAEEKKLINDESYAEVLIYELAEVKKYGPVRIKAETYRHGVAKEICEELIGKYYEKDENGLCAFDRNMYEMALLKAKNLDLNDKAGKDKLFAALNRLGYEFSRISKLRFNKK